MSQTYHPQDHDELDWDCAEVHAPRIIKALLAEGIDRDVLINVNFPGCPAAAVKGVSVTVQGRRDMQLVRLERRNDGRGNPYYWIAFERDVTERRPGTDIAAVGDNRISVTPLKLDMTDEVSVTRYARLFDHTNSPFCRKSAPNNCGAALRLAFGVTKFVKSLIFM